MSDVAAMLSKEILGHMKNECGGLQTLLKSSHHIFRGKSNRIWLETELVYFSSLVTFKTLYMA